MTKAQAEENRKTGNDCVKEGKFIEAIIHYTHAIKQDPRNPEYYSNRSLALLKVDQYYHARLDAIKALEIKPDWPKAYYRKGEVEYKAEHYKDALQSYKYGLSISPEDTGLQQAVKKATEAFKSQRQKENRIPWYGTGLGFLIGLIIVVADETVAPKPILQHILLKLILMAAFVGLGYGGALIYKWFQNNQRAVLLEEPVDLFGDGKDDDLMYPKAESTEPSENNHKKNEKHKKGGAGAARQRFKKGKS